MCRVAEYYKLLLYGFSTQKLQKILIDLGFIHYYGQCFPSPNLGEGMPPKAERRGSKYRLLMNCIEE